MYDIRNIKEKKSLNEKVSVSCSLSRWVKVKDQEDRYVGKQSSQVKECW